MAYSFLDDSDALKTLRENGPIREVHNGILRLPVDYTPGDIEWAAIEYLVEEWDFSWVRSMKGKS